MGWFALTLVAIAGAAIGWNARTRAGWRALAKELGLPFSEQSYWLRWTMRGTLRGCAVTVMVHQPSDRRRGVYTAITVQPEPAIDIRMTLRPEDLKSRALKLIGTDDDQVGDAAFDQEVLVHGPATTLLSVLNQPTRAATMRVLGKWRVHVEGGALHCDTYGVLANTRKLRALLHDMVGLAHRLRRPADGDVTAVQRMLSSDPEVGVRRRCLDVLLARPGPIAHAAATTAMQDVDPDLRRLAALAAGPAGFDTLIGLLRDPRLSAADADAILDTLQTHAPKIAAVEVERLIHGPPRPASSIAVRIAARLDLRDCLTRINALAAHPNLARACAEALGIFDDPAGEPGFIAILDAVDIDVQRQAVAALARRGTRAALGPLRQLRARRLRAEAEDAIAHITARVAPGGGGTLALAADTVGGLSPIAARAGSLSAPELQDDP
ncbi:MAG: HEAT repeat protein [Bradymonadia bacterium]